MSLDCDHSVKILDLNSNLSKKTIIDSQILRWGVAWIVSVVTVPALFTGWAVIENEAGRGHVTFLDYLLYIVAMVGFFSMFCLIPATLGLLAVAVLRAVWGWHHITIWITLGAIITGISLSWLSLMVEWTSMPAFFLIALSIGGAVAAALAWVAVFAGRHDRPGPS